MEISMKRDDLVKMVISILEKADFSTSDPSFLVHSGFDIVARRGDLILVIKAISSRESVKADSINGMVALARAVEGVPLMIGVGKSSGNIEDGVVYSRYGISLMSVNSLHDLFIEEVPPLVYSAPGGFYVRLDTEGMGKLRQQGISLGELAETAGVSRRTIQMYEEGMGAKLTAAIRLENAFGIDLIIPIDPLTVRMKSENMELCGDIDDDEMVTNIFEQLNEMGYMVEPTNRCPFDALTSDRENLLFTGIGRIDRNIKRRAMAMANISKLLDRHAVFFVENRGTKTNLEGTPLISNIELGKIYDKKKILELIKERG